MRELEKQYQHILYKINELLKKKKDIIIAIDGKCGAGKSQLGQFLKEYYDASLFKMDDFFLQDFQRTNERLLEAGGNVDYERFKYTVIDSLLLKNNVKYQRFDCSQMKLNDEVEIILYHPINIIEGTYSLHPYFKHYYDISIVLDISDDMQKNRILKRNGKDKWEMFEKKWIPLENKYFKQYHIYENADIISDNEKIIVKY